MYKFAKNYETVHLEWVNFIVYKLYPNPTQGVKGYKRDSKFQEKVIDKQYRKKCNICTIDVLKENQSKGTE